LPASERWVFPVIYSVFEESEPVPDAVTKDTSNYNTWKSTHVMSYDEAFGFPQDAFTKLIALFKTLVSEPFPSQLHSFKLNTTLKKLLLLHGKPIDEVQIDTVGPSTTLARLLVAVLYKVKGEFGRKESRESQSSKYLSRVLGQPRDELPVCE
jgi:hypothetical protein